VLRAEESIGPARTRDSRPAGGSRHTLRRIAGSSFARQGTVPRQYSSAFGGWRDLGGKLNVYARRATIRVAVRGAEQAIATWPTTATSVGVRYEGDVFDVCAPYGLSDLFGLIVRPNTTLVSRAIYEAWVKRWRQLWPLLTVQAWPGR
jgi:hypothetical protein